MGILWDLKFQKKNYKPNIQPLIYSKVMFIILNKIRLVSYRSHSDMFYHEHVLILSYRESKHRHRAWGIQALCLGAVFRPNNSVTPKTCAHMHAHGYMWQSEVNVWCLPKWQWKVFCFLFLFFSFLKKVLKQ